MTDRGETDTESGDYFVVRVHCFIPDREEWLQVPEIVDADWSQYSSGARCAHRFWESECRFCHASELIN